MRETFERLRGLLPSWYQVSWPSRSAVPRIDLAACELGTWESKRLPGPSDAKVHVQRGCDGEWECRAIVRALRKGGDKSGSYLEVVAARTADVGIAIEAAVDFMALFGGTLTMHCGPDQFPPRAPSETVSYPRPVRRWFTAGDRVQHSKFGKGIVQSVDGHRLQIAFPCFGLKTILDAFVSATTSGAA